MMAGWKRIETGVFVALVVGVVISIYQILFCVWMLAHPMYASTEWETRLGIRLATLLALGGAILFIVVMRRRRKHRASG